LPLAACALLSGTPRIFTFDLCTSASFRPCISMAEGNPFAHLIASLGWQRQRAENLIRRWMIFRGARGTVNWRWPWPFEKPWQRARLRLCSHGGGIGDELMCTPIFREIRRLNP